MKNNLIPNCFETSIEVGGKGEGQPSEHLELIVDEARGFYKDYKKKKSLGLRCSGIGFPLLGIRLPSDLEKPIKSSNSLTLTAGSFASTALENRSRNVLKSVGQP